jgi:hypothetical protein
MDLMTPIYILGNRHFKIKRLIGQKAEAEGVNRWDGPHAWGGGGGFCSSKDGGSLGSTDFSHYELEGVWQLLSFRIDGQVCLIRLVSIVRLQTDNIRLFFRQQMDKRQTSVCTMSKR